MKRKQKTTKVPGPGEVWESLCAFSKKEDDSGLRPGVNRNEDGDLLPPDCMGVEIRTVLAVIDIPGYQRRVIYKRQFRPDGHAPFGKRGLMMVGLGAFNSWRAGTLRRHMRPAILVTPSLVEDALDAIRQRVAA